MKLWQALWQTVKVSSMGLDLNWHGLQSPVPCHSVLQHQVAHTTAVLNGIISRVEELT